MAGEALFISEIFREVCEQLKFDLGQDGPSWLRDLARLSRCCWGFSEVALDVLWEDLDSFKPLLGLISPSVLDTSFGDGETSSALPSANTSNWDRFDFYARRVRTLHYQHPANEYCHRLSHLKPGPLLPLLKELYWREPPQPQSLHLTSTLEFTSFLVPSLVKIDILLNYYSHPGNELNNLLRGLPLHCPRVHTLYFDNLDPTTSLRFLGAFEHLQTLQLDSINNAPIMRSESLRGLSQLRHLTRLDGLRVSSTITQGSFLPGFSSLRHLGIMGEDTPGVNVLLDIIPSTSLKSLDIDQMDNPTWDEYVLTLNKISSKGSSITKLNLIYGGFPDVPAPEVIADGLSSLELPSLTNLMIWQEYDRIYDSLDKTFTPESAVKMASAWPNLRKLRLQYCSAMFSVESLGVFVSQVPSLQHIIVAGCFETKNPLSTGLEFSILFH
ncbi:hypothetical protein JAAARDRAFT_77530 [Jaapia argillacea MUCL 33604]|uniref:F-box domain-containing protein n=1 Tax=Jaapia argillacea MUCL 33604 TaxID=933084 RepID=A0A067QAI5_9AGAM|nr:hypothetical protein JAAARDRAFT_77530 [Jaapia argillacea MUCL 33604]